MNFKYYNPLDPLFLKGNQKKPYDKTTGSYKVKKMIKHDVIIVGSGLAGMQAALEVCKDFDTAIITKV